MRWRESKLVPRGARRDESDPQRGLTEVEDTPGSMVYGNTVIYGENEIENWANLASYFLVDILGQQERPSGHGLNPVPVSEATRIPDVDEVVRASRRLLFATLRHSANPARESRRTRTDEDRGWQTQSSSSGVSGRRGRSGYTGC